jgi:hypothetical protein
MLLILIALFIIFPIFVHNQSRVYFQCKSLTIGSCFLINVRKYSVILNKSLYFKKFCLTFSPKKYMSALHEFSENSDLMTRGPQQELQEFWHVG